MSSADYGECRRFNFSAAQHRGVFQRRDISLGSLYAMAWEKRRPHGFGFDPDGVAEDYLGEMLGMGMVFICGSMKSIVSRLPITCSFNSYSA